MDGKPPRPGLPQARGTPEICCPCLVPLAIPPLHAAPVPWPGTQFVDIDVFQAPKIDTHRRGAVGHRSLGIALYAARRAEAVVQRLLAELVIALLGLAGLQRELGLGREGPYRSCFGADRAVALQRRRRVDLHGEGNGATVTASGVGLRTGHGVLLDWFTGWLTRQPIQSNRREDTIFLRGSAITPARAATTSSRW